jgi:hypothetical protein
MAACAMLTYNKVTQQAWQCIQQAFSQYGIVITSDSGCVTKEGFTFSWNYDVQTDTLSIQCTDHPQFVNCSTINYRINDGVEACLKQHGIELASMILAQ